ncbi:MAG: hypothetical protein H6727_19900 [Myxococcales bacterium]|nr:hypothetical protein [Myxococcales bacterium]
MARYRGREHYDDYQGSRRGNQPNMALFWGIAAMIVVGGIAVYFFTSRRPNVGPGYNGYISQGQGPKQQAPAMQPIEVGDPKIDLKAVEEALWSTKGKDEKDFSGWMKRFEDEVNAIYFATLKRQKPNADPTTLLPSPVRVEPKRNNNLLTLYGYIDQNKKQGYQNGEDKLIFAFQQTKPYDQAQRQLSYSLRDGSGYYYRQPDYAHSYSTGVSPFFLGFFVYPMIWHAVWWRSSFMWYGSAYWWRTGAFYSRYNYYYGRYPSYYGYYRNTYYTRHRPMGWSRGSYYRRGAGGRYYRSGSYGSRARYRRSGSYGGSRYGGSRSSGSRYGGSRSGGSRSYGGSRSGGGKW